MVDLDDYLRDDDYHDWDVKNEDINNAFLGCAKRPCHIWAFSCTSRQFGKNLSSLAFMLDHFAQREPGIVILNLQIV